ncbi:MAG TPA: flagellar motor switch protein FliG [Solirubrobacteraceae bacterium]|jgi:flagellar motor switch protein FliG|nr:flagellar motor switch protein FliG [Solirubrobacteraceae bacterium]
MDTTLDRPQGDRLSGRQKAAVVLISLGTEKAANILQHLSEREVESLSAEVAALWRVRPETSAAVLSEVAERLQARDMLGVGGPEYAREVLEHLLGPERAEEIMGTLTTKTETRPFEFLRRTPPEQVCAFLKDESPQTIALVVASVHSSLAARVLAELPPELQAEVALRIATMSETNPDVIRDIEQGLRQKLANVVAQEFAAAGGVDALAEILNRAGRSTERNVVGAIGDRDQQLADEIRSRLFTFEDLVILEDRDLQLVLREVDQKELQLALRGVDQVVVDKVLGNMSQRGAEMLREDMEASPPQRKAVVEEAQGKIVAAVRRLEDAGALVLRRGAEDEEEVV